MDNSTRASTDALQKLYFTGTTLSDLGYGDLVPRHFPWTVLSSLAALTATLLTSAAISYVLPVVSAGVRKRQLASSLHSLGQDPKEIIEHVWPLDGKDMSDYVLTILTQLQSFAHSHMSYPVLLYFHSDEKKRSISLGILHLADALFLMGHGVAPSLRPSKGFMHIADETVREYVSLTVKDLASKQAMEALARSPDLTLETLKELGMETVSPAEFDDSVRLYLKFREKLVRLCVEDGWLIKKGNTALPAA